MQPWRAAGLTVERTPHRCTSGLKGFSGRSRLRLRYAGLCAPGTLASGLGRAPKRPRTAIYSVHDRHGGGVAAPARSALLCAHSVRTRGNVAGGHARTSERSPRSPTSPGRGPWNAHTWQRGRRQPTGTPPCQRRSAPASARSGNCSRCPRPSPWTSSASWSSPAVSNHAARAGAATLRHEMANFSLASPAPSPAAGTAGRIGWLLLTRQLNFAFAAVEQQHAATRNLGCTLLSLQHLWLRDVESHVDGAARQQRTRELAPPTARPGTVSPRLWTCQPDHPMLPLYLAPCAAMNPPHAFFCSAAVENAHVESSRRGRIRPQPLASCGH